MSADVATVQFAAAEDAAELIRELTVEGYTVDLRESAPGTWLLEVQPSDDRLVEMVDVYGGWLPGDVQAPSD